MIRIFSGYVESERIYSLYPGVYQFDRWAAIIERDGNRYTPESKNSECRIAFLGDSVTFGFGVNDEETFVNVLAKQMDAHVMNTALLGYNSENILATIEDVPANGYVYVIVGNDDDVTAHWAGMLPRIPSLETVDVFGVHYEAFRFHFGEIKRNRARFDADLQAIMARDDVLEIGFVDRFGWYKQLPPDVLIIPSWTQSVSVADGHPNRQGHAEIAAALMPHVRAFEAQVCE